MKTTTDDWMRRLADHYARFRQDYPDDRLLIVFDIDGTILDLRHMVRHVLLDYEPMAVTSSTASASRRSTSTRTGSRSS